MSRWDLEVHDGVRHGGNEVKLDRLLIGELARLSKLGGDASAEEMEKAGASRTAYTVMARLGWIGLDPEQPELGGLTIGRRDHRGGRVQGCYRITPLGWDFQAGLVRVWDWVWRADSVLLGRDIDARMITIDEVRTRFHRIRHTREHDVDPVPAEQVPGYALSRPRIVPQKPQNPTDWSF